MTVNCLSLFSVRRETEWSLGLIRGMLDGVGKEGKGGDGRDDDRDDQNGEQAIRNDGGTIQTDCQQIIMTVSS